MRKFVCSVILLVSLALVPACEDDPTGCYDCDGFLLGQQALPLTTREAVLNNIEYAYNKRVVSAYDELLDLEFTFFFSQGDGFVPMGIYDVISGLLLLVTYLRVPRGR